MELSEERLRIKRLRYGSKPHLRRFGAGWSCLGRGELGFGLTARAAYATWLYLLHDCPTYKPPVQGAR